MNRLRFGSKRPAGVFNIAHRGARAFAPENTLPAFAKAQKFGCPIIEIDVHQTKDKVLVVHHDDDLTRCTNVRSVFPDRHSYYLSDFTWDEIIKLDAGNWFIDQLYKPPQQRQWYLHSLSEEEINQHISADDRQLYASGTVGVPTLSQTLELARDLNLMVNVELKMIPRMYPGMSDAVVELIEAIEFSDQVLISSFDHEQLLTVRRRTNRIATAVLTGDRLACVNDYLKTIDADAYHPSTGSVGLDSLERKLDIETTAKLIADGFMVNVWTCNDKTEMRQLVAMGVSGLISDYPNRVDKVLSEMQ